MQEQVKIKLFSIVRLKFLMGVYVELTKSLQTALLVITGITGFISGTGKFFEWKMLFAFTIILFLTIAGTTVFNMIWDKDIDAIMHRTCRRPLPSAKITSNHAFVFGLLILSIGLVWGFFLSPKYAAVLFAGFFFDFVIYTIWLKRKTSWSIFWGGISGAMPILAGRVLAIGYIDLVGLWLVLGILLWIPIHILTFAIKYDSDYRRANVPTFVQTLGIKKARIIIALSSIFSTLAFISAAGALSISSIYVVSLCILASILIFLSLYFIVKPSDKVNFLLFKSASLFMLLANVVIIIGKL